MNFDRDKGVLNKSRSDGKITWRSFWDPNGFIGGAWDIEHIPASYVIDAKGVIRCKPKSVQEQDAFVETLLAEMEGRK